MLRFTGPAYLPDQQFFKVLMQPWIIPRIAFVSLEPGASGTALPIEVRPLQTKRQGFVTPAPATLVLL